jgi:RHS repeat-associated protein
LQGAGGIGGLLARTDSSNVYYHADGAGNITALSDANQNIVARYEYDAFGRLIAKSGALADANRYRFSSKEAHPASGLYYYGFRFYDPSLQRWLNQDPIGEDGGINLYGFVENSPLTQIDSLGLNSASEVKNGVTFWYGAFEQKPPGAIFVLNGNNYLLKPLDKDWQITDSGEAILVAHDLPLQPSLLGELLIPTGLGALGKPMMLAGRARCVTSQFARGRLYEAERLSARGVIKNTSVFRPTLEQTKSAAFSVIVGQAKRTSVGQFVGTIVDSTEFGLLEIKSGSSVLDSTYQLRLQVYQSVVNKIPLTIESSRPVNQAFLDYLTRWGVNVTKP